MAAEPRAFLFDVELFRNVNCFRPEVIEVSREQSKLLALLKIAMGWLVVPPCLFIGPYLHRLFLFESPVGKVLPSCKLFIDPHCINELPMAGASLTRPASTYDPISLVRQFNNIPLALR